MPPNVMGVAAGTGRVGCVLLIHGKLADWRMSNKASKSPTLARAQTHAWIALLEPNVVVTRDTDGPPRSRGRTVKIVAAIAEAARLAEVISVSLPRPMNYPNKYAEAAALVQRYPEIDAWTPNPRRFYDNEPRNTVLFEALSLADALVRSGPIGLAGALG